ncbi:hypothetical protein N7474_005128 [Penicillium riverlandense]|uniref:uncharacterized protein n=1 Tax=Penicillium riverlandense TaxID=1903569 RepID=UPI002547C12D|nr:uncharacterized protein N7474_005128 [Penicillium riverlandense]KAJ5819537.1 hypothetical protein N7474_005128 [Penicillium riverlandense]
MVASVFSSAARPLGPAALALLGVLLWLCAISGANAEETSFYKSRPDIYPPVFKVELSNPKKLSPGYYFITPYEAKNPGPYIFDNDGELVWSGWGNSGPGNAHGMHVCKYQGADHLCFFQGNQQKGYCRGHGVILDNQYRIVRSVQPGGGMASSDMHEFRPVGDGKTALMTVYQQRQFDMTPWNIKTGVGWLMESIFQEVDVQTSKVLFEWRALDHVDPSMSYTWPAHTDTSGTGLHVTEPWDYFHINSIDKNADGDYLVSSRHTCAIYKISGKDGSVIWRLHGANPSFKNINFSFSQQHDARWLYENATHSVISLYNNGFNGFNQTHTYSSGMIILIDHIENTATQLRDYGPPSNRMLSSSQGNLQIMPNRNVVIGWGNNPYVSEHTEDGELVMWLRFATNTVMNYRAHKFEWDADPSDSPALWTYSRSADPFSPTTFYVSWNGATRVKKWRFYGAANMTGPYTLLDEVAKNGFETEYTNTSFYTWTKAEAIDRNGEVLASSARKYTFVPSPELREFCRDQTCEDASAYGFPGDDRATSSIPPAGVNTVPWIDPDNPKIWSQPSSTPQHIYSHHKNWTMGRMLAWGAMILVLIPLIGIAVYALRYYQRRQREMQQRFAVDPTDESVEPLNGMAEGKPFPMRTGMPWWNWRRWIGEEDEPHYFPLSERSPRRERME